jgi:hypothetical protein
MQTGIFPRNQMKKNCIQIGFKIQKVIIFGFCPFGSGELKMLHLIPWKNSCLHVLADYLVLNAPKRTSVMLTKLKLNLTPSS